MMIEICLKRARQLITLSACFGCLLIYIDSYGQTPNHSTLRPMRDVLETAYQRAPERIDANGRRAVIQAKYQQFQDFFSGPSSAKLAQREGSRSGPNQASETEWVLSAPLWHLRQRHEGIQLTEFEQSVAQLWELLTRLQLLKAIRDVHRNLLLTEAEVEISRANAKAYQSLLEDVERRVLAGDLAPADKLAAKSSVLEALSKVKESEQVLQNHSNAWFQLTGSHERPEVENFHQQPELRLDQHIAWQYSQAQIALAERSLAFISEFRQEKPIANVGLRQEKSSGNSHQSIMASITVPIGGESKQRSLIAEARAQRDLRVGEHLRLERQLHAEFERTVRNAENAKVLLAIEQERATVLHQRSTLVEKAFAAGEASLPTLLLALSQTRAVQTQVSRRAVELRLSMAQLSQAAGVLP